jgi:hypothetical protein
MEWGLLVTIGYVALVVMAMLAAILAGRLWGKQ